MIMEWRRNFRDPQHLAHKVLERTSASLILVAMGAVPFDPANMGSEWKTAFGLLEIGIVAFFTAEYALRIWIAEKPWRYVFSFFGAIDLLAIVPFYFFPGTNTSVVRAIRLLRLIRVFRIRGFDDASIRLGRALHDVRREAAIFLITSALVLYIAAVGIHEFEKHAQPENFGTLSKSAWWMLGLLLDIEFGEIWPETVGGKAFSALIAFVGVAIVAVPAGLAASALTRIARDEDLAKRKTGGEVAGADRSPD